MERTEWEDDAPHIWVGCLACYNNMNLRGDWFMAVDGDNITPDDLHTKNISPMFPHEELWVMDYENFHGLLQGECSPMEAAAIAKAMAAAAERLEHVPLAVACRYAHNVDPAGSTDTVEDRIVQAGEAFVGTGTLADVVQEFYESSTDPEQKTAMGDLWNYISWERIANDWDCTGYFSVDDDDHTTYWFRPM